MDNVKMPWWAYQHTNNSITVKRYFGPDDITEALESDFVLATTGPFHATSRDDAMRLAKVRFGDTS